MEPMDPKNPMDPKETSALELLRRIRSILHVHKSTDVVGAALHAAWFARTYAELIRDVDLLINRADRR